MLHYKEGKLSTATEDIIAHQTNCQRVMGSGTALDIRNNFPKAYQEYMSYCPVPSAINQDNANLLGICQIVDIANGRYVANLFAQQYYGRDKVQYTNYAALFKAIGQICWFAKERGLSIAMPLGIGCGRGGGDWALVEGFIKTIVDSYGINVTLYKFKEK